jgi:hypothetical protein
MPVKIHLQLSHRALFLDMACFFGCARHESKSEVAVGRTSEGRRRDERCRVGAGTGMVMIISVRQSPRELLSRSLQIQI